MKLKYWKLALGSLVALGAEMTTAAQPKIEFAGRLQTAYLFETTKQDLIKLDDEGNAIIVNGRPDTASHRSSVMGFVADSRIGGRATVERGEWTGKARFEINLHRSLDVTGVSISPRDAWLSAENKNILLRLGRQEFGAFYAFERPYFAFNSHEIILGSLIGRDEGLLVEWLSAENWTLKLGIELDNFDTENTSTINPVVMRHFGENTVGGALSMRTITGEDRRGGSDDYEDTAQQISLWYKGLFGRWEPQAGLQITQRTAEDLDQPETDLDTTELLLGLNYLQEAYRITSTLFQETVVLDPDNGDKVETTTTTFSLAYGRELAEGFTWTSGFRTSMEEEDLDDTTIEQWSVSSGLSYYF